MSNDYYNFLRSKVASATPRGLAQMPDLSPALFGYQREVTEFLLGIGSGAAFLDTGMGKSIIELEYARAIAEHTRRPVLMLAPLAVGPQHVREAEKFNIGPVRTVRNSDEVAHGVNIANYERLHLFNREQFSGIVLDESSIIKNFTGKTTRALMAFAQAMPWKLAATATPAPNDHMELGQHAQFLDVMDSSEMLARWFIADQKEMGRYRLKRYGVRSFWSWVASWSRMMTKPSDLGYSDDGFILPPLDIKRHYVHTDITKDTDGMLFRMPDTSATAIHQEKRRTSAERAEQAAQLVTDDSNECWVVWVETDYDADAVMARLPDAVEVRGSMRPEEKEARLVDFSTGNIRVLVTKPSIAGFGLNWQHCARTCYSGLSFSYEKLYQTLRRFWRFGQQRPVQAHIILADTEETIWRIIQRKQADHELMKNEMAAAMRRATETRTVKIDYQPTMPANLPDWIRSAL